MSRVLTKLGTMFGPVTPAGGGKFIGNMTKLGSAFDPPTVEVGGNTLVADPTHTATAPAGSPPPLIPASPPGSAEEVTLKAMIRELAVARKTDPTAQAKLERIRDQEYARPDGGRLGVKRMLSGAASLGKPKA